MEPEDRKGLCGRRWTREASGGKGGTGGVSKARSRKWAVPLYRSVQGCCTVLHTVVIRTFELKDDLIKKLFNENRRTRQSYLAPKKIRKDVTPCSCHDVQYDVSLPASHSLCIILTPKEW